MLTLTETDIEALNKLVLDFRHREAMELAGFLQRIVQRQKEDAQKKAEAVVPEKPASNGHATETPTLQ